MNESERFTYKFTNIIYAVYTETLCSRMDILNYREASLKRKVLPSSCQMFSFHPMPHKLNNIFIYIFLFVEYVDIT